MPSEVSRRRIFEVKIVALQSQSRLIPTSKRFSSHHGEGEADTWMLPHRCFGNTLVGQERYGEEGGGKNRHVNCNKGSLPPSHKGDLLVEVVPFSLHTDPIYILFLRGSVAILAVCVCWGEGLRTIKFVGKTP